MTDLDGIEACCMSEERIDWADGKGSDVAGTSTRAGCVPVARAGWPGCFLGTSYHDKAALDAAIDGVSSKPPAT